MITTEKEFLCRELRGALEVWELEPKPEIRRRIRVLCDRLDEIERGMSHEEA